MSIKPFFLFVLHLVDEQRNIAYSEKCEFNPVGHGTKSTGNKKSDVVSTLKNVSIMFK